MSNRKVCVKCNLLFEVRDIKRLSPNYNEEVKTCRFCLLAENNYKDNNVTQRCHKHR